MTDDDLEARRSELRLRARQLSKEGPDLTQWLEEEIAKADNSLALRAVEVELATRQREQGKSSNTRWLAGFVWIFVIVVIVAHALSG